MASLNSTDTRNVLAWVKECRRRNSNTIANTFTGKWLDAGLNLIVRQYDLIQDMRNAEIERTAVDRTSDEIKELLHALDSVQGGKFSLLSWQASSTIRNLLAEINDKDMATTSRTDHR